MAQGFGNVVFSVSYCFYKGHSSLLSECVYLSQLYSSFAYDFYYVVCVCVCVCVRWSGFGFHFQLIFLCVCVTVCIELFPCVRLCVCVE